VAFKILGPLEGSATALAGVGNMINMNPDMAGKMVSLLPDKATSLPLAIELLGMTRTVWNVDGAEMGDQELAVLGRVATIGPSAGLGVVYICR